MKPHHTKEASVTFLSICNCNSKDLNVKELPLFYERMYWFEFKELQSNKMSYTKKTTMIIIIIIIIIIILFESQIILAEHECCTNWGDCESNKSNQIKCWFLRRGENRSSRRKTSRIWNNQDIKIDNKTIFFRTWFDKGVHNVKVLVDQNLDFPTYEEFQLR